MKLVKSAIIATLVAFAAVAVASDVSLDIEQQLAKAPRAKVVKMTVELELPDGSTMVVDNMDFCTPGGFYKGVEGVVFGDEAVKIMQAGMAALYPKVGDKINQMWNNKNHPEDPRLPTFLMIKAPEKTTDIYNKKFKRKGAANEDLPMAFRSTASLMKVDNLTPMVLSTCGGYNHPPGGISR